MEGALAHEAPWSPRSRAALAAGALGTAARYAFLRAIRVPAQPLEAVADRVWTLVPRSVEPARRPFVLESQLARIRPSVLGESRDEILAQLALTEIVHRPSRALLLRDAVLFDRHLYCGVHREDLFRGVGRWNALLKGEAEELPEALWVTGYADSRWLGHLLRDQLSLEELARPLGRLIGQERPVYPHEPDWRTEFGSPRPRTFSLARIRELTCFDDYAQHADKRRRYQALRRRLPPRAGGHERVLLLRGRSGGEERRVLNESEMVERLLREGFKAFDPARVPVREIIERCWNAEVVVTVEGSHAAPVLYLGRPGATVVYLMPPARVALHSPRLAQFFGLNGAMFIGEPVEGSDGVFRVDPEELVRTVEQAVAAAPAA